MGLNPAPVTEDRSFADILADVPDCPDEAMYVLLDECAKWLSDTSVEPPGGTQQFFVRCSAALTDLNSAGAVVNALTAEFKGTRHARSLHQKGLSDFHEIRGVISAAKPAVEKSIRELKLRGAHLTKGPRVHAARTFRWNAAEASVLALREIDLALEAWRDTFRNPTVSEAVLTRINDAVSNYYDAGELPDDTGPTEAVVSTS